MGNEELDRILKNINKPKFDFDLKLSEINPIKPPMIDTSYLNKMVEEINEERAKKEEAKYQYDQEVLELLRGIHSNTSNMTSMLEFIRSNADRQTDILILITEILSIGTAKTSDEADSKYREVMNKINTTVEDVESMNKLMEWAQTAWNFVKLGLKTHGIDLGE